MSMNLFRVMFTGEITVAAWDELDATVKASKKLANQYPVEIKLDSENVQKVKE